MPIPVEDASIFAVFWQRDALSQPTYVGSVRAVTERAALEVAREAFFRRDSAFDVWVVRQDFIAHARTVPEMLPQAGEAKLYRMPSGYDNAPLWKTFKSHTQKIEDVAQEMADPCGKEKV